jgi:hypothetical protein
VAFDGRGHRIDDFFTQLTPLDFLVIPSELQNSPSVSLSTGQTKESDIKRNGNQKAREFRTIVS